MMLEEITVATASITNPDAAYSRVYRQFISAWKEGENANIKRYHDLGGLFDEFCQGVDRAAYGERKVDHLVEDLTTAGIFREGEDARRRLYWARGVYRTYPDFDVLSQLAERGFTVTHLKAMLGVSDAIRVQAEKLLLQNGKVIPTREFVEAVEKLCRESVRSDAIAATSPTPAIATAAPATTEEEVEAALGVEEDVGADTNDGGPLATPTADDAPIPAAAAERGVGGDAPVSQKSIKDMDKALIRVTALVPDVIITVRGRAQEGFDSEPARRRFYESLRNIRTAISDLREPLGVLLANIDDELGSDVDAIPRTE